LGQYVSLNTGLHHTFEWAQASGYGKNPTRNRTALFSSLKVRDAGERFMGLVSIRQERAGNASAPVVPSLGGTIKLSSSLKLRLNATRTYRLPTFNDLYWRPGGNPDLLPENGWSQDGSIVYQRSAGSLYAEAELTGYNSRIRNWIIWLPNGTNWSPENLQFVWSRGLEATGKITRRTGLLTLTLTGFYSYVRSTNEKARFPGDPALHKQLLYNPRHQAGATAGVIWRQLSLGYNHRYTGHRFTTSDETGPLPAYQVGTLTLSRSFAYRTLSFDLQSRVHNLWNSSYQVIAWQAMPGRYFQISLFTQFKPDNP
jgi:iron complex outermembrane receptor protein